jgi:hypothetical protein
VFFIKLLKALVCFTVSVVFSCCDVCIKEVLNKQIYAKIENKQRASVHPISELFLVKICNDICPQPFLTKHAQAISTNNLARRFCLMNGKEEKLWFIVLSGETLAIMQI